MGIEGNVDIDIQKLQQQSPFKQPVYWSGDRRMYCNISVCRLADPPDETGRSVRSSRTRLAYHSTFNPDV